MGYVSKYLKLKFLGSVMTAVLLVSACESLEDPEKPPLKKYANAVDPASRDVALARSQEKVETGAMEQITLADISATQEQLDNPDEDNEAVAQLREYVDQCAPGVKRSVKVDCSQLELRVRKQYKDEDELIRALSTIDRLTKNPDSVADDLSRNAGDLSPEAQAVAGGLLTPEVEQPVDEDKADEEALGADAIKAAIIKTLGG